MTIYFAGTSIADLTMNGSAVVSTDTNSKRTRVAEAIQVTPSNNKNVMTWPNKMSEGWISFSVSVGNNGSSTTFDWFGLIDTGYSPTQPIWRLSGLSSCKLEYWWGGGWTEAFNFGDNFFRTTGVVKYDINFKIADTGGYIKVYQNGVLVGQTSNPDTRILASWAGIDAVCMQSGGNATCIYSEVIASDKDTRAYQLHQVLPTGNGTHTAWTGDYTAVDETGASDTDFITTTTDGAMETFTFPALSSLLNTLTLEGIVLSSRVQGGSTAPTKVKGLARIAGTDYEKAGDGATPTAYGAHQVIYSVNPATGLQWVGAEVSSVEFGYKAIT